MITKVSAIIHVLKHLQDLGISSAILSSEEYGFVVFENHTFFPPL